MESSSPPKPFLGFRFALVGFNPVDESKLRSKLVSGGGVDVGRFSQNYTHLIVDRLIYDDPICVAARTSGKIVVLGSWVDHSFDTGIRIDANSVLYRPPKDLNGIPGAKSLIVCLTGYQRQDRDDIMAMVALMGGQFSKPLVANKVTHLICYKFEGEKYELAKRMKKIKLVNHRWLEDCLKAWKLLPEVDYEISGYELEMMEASAKDSEDEAEGASMERANKSPLGLRVGVAVDGNMLKSVEENVPVIHTKSSTQANLLSTKTAKDLWLTPKKVSRPHEAMASTDVVPPPQHDCEKPSTFQDAFHKACADPLDKKLESREVKDDLTSICKSSERFLPMAPLQRDCPKTSTFQDASRDGMFSPLDKTPESREANDGVPSISRSTERFSSLATKLNSLTYSRKTGKRLPDRKSPGDESSIHSGSRRTTDGDFEDITASDISALKSYSAAEGTSVLEDSHMIDKLDEKETLQTLPQKRSTGGYVSSSKSQKVGFGGEANAESPNFLLPELDLISLEQNLMSVSSIGCPTEGGEAVHDLPAIDRKDGNHTSEDMTSVEAMAEIITKKTPERSVTELVKEKTSTVPDLLELASNDHPDTELRKKKTASRKTLGTRPKVKKNSNEKGSIYLSKTVLSNDRTNCLSRGKFATTTLGNDNQEEISNPATNSESRKERAKQGNFKDTVLDKIDHANDENNPAEEKPSHEFDSTVNQNMLVEIEGQREADAEVEARLVEPELNDGSNADAPDDTTESGLDKKKSKCRKEAFGGKSKVENAKKRDLHTAEVGTANIKKSKKTRKENNARENDKEKENLPVNKKSQKVGEDENSSMGKPLAKKETATSSKTLTEMDKKSEISSTSNSMVSRKVLHDRGKKSACFIVSGPRFQKKEYQQIIKRLKGKICRDSHQWSYQATHFITPEIRRTEKFFAATASGSWILKGDYLPACSQAGRFLPEEPFEWHDNSLSQDGAINLEAPRKWRLVKEKTGHGAFYGMRIIVYGDCIVPSLDTIKRAVKAGDGTILATAPPYKRFLNSDTDFAVIRPGMPRVDAWIQEFLSHEIPCVLADYLVEYVCKPGYPLDKHVLYSTKTWAERSYNKLQQRMAEEVVEDNIAKPSDPLENDDIACEVCGGSDREEVMLICGDEKNTRGCGIGTHIDCCDPPMPQVPDQDWFCPRCSDNTPTLKRRKGKRD